MWTWGRRQLTPSRVRMIPATAAARELGCHYLSLIALAKRGEIRGEERYTYDRYGNETVRWFVSVADLRRISVVRVEDALHAGRDRKARIIIGSA